MGENGRSRERRDSCQASNRVIQGTVFPACLTSKPLGLSERRCDSQHPLRRSTKTPGSPRTRDPRQKDRTFSPSIFLKAGYVSTRFSLQTAGAARYSPAPASKMPPKYSSRRNSSTAAECRLPASVQLPCLRSPTRGTTTLLRCPCKYTCRPDPEPFERSARFA